LVNFLQRQPPIACRKNFLEYVQCTVHVKGGVQDDFSGSKAAFCKRFRVNIIIIGLKKTTGGIQRFENYWHIQKVLL
jgi:hypothetical protein